jgi:hypothetical protein
MVSTDRPCKHIYMELITSREEIVLYVTLHKEIGALPTGG